MVVIGGSSSSSSAKQTDSPLSFERDMFWGRGSANSRENGRVLEKQGLEVVIVVVGVVAELVVVSSSSSSSMWSVVSRSSPPVKYEITSLVGGCLYFATLSFVFSCSSGS